MAPFPPPLGDVLIGWLHTLGMGVLLGATALVWAIHRTERLELPPPVAVQLAATYEAVFWAGAGVVVVAGVARLGPALEAGTAGVTSLAAYLVALLVVLAGSLIRSFGVAELRRGSLPEEPAAVLARLQRSYVVTAAALLVVAVLAEVAAGG